MARAERRVCQSTKPIYLNCCFAKLNGLNSFNDITSGWEIRHATKATRRSAVAYRRTVKEVVYHAYSFYARVATMIATGGANISDEESSDHAQKSILALFERKTAVAALQ